MIEVRCKGKIYAFSDGSGILDLLAARASDIRDDPVPPDGTPVYTHDEAARIVERFEDLLCANDIEIPCADPDEQAERHDGGNAAALYGTEYSDLLDDTEDVLVGMLQAAGTKNFIQGEFSGNY